MTGKELKKIADEFNEKAVKEIVDSYEDKIIKLLKEAAGRGDYKAVLKSDSFPDMYSLNSSITTQVVRLLKCRMKELEIMLLTGGSVGSDYYYIASFGEGI